MLRPLTTTWAPSAPNARAIARPMLLVAPVTNAVFPGSLFVTSFPSMSRILKLPAGSTTVSEGNERGLAAPRRAAWKLPLLVGPRRPRMALLPPLPSRLFRATTRTPRRQRCAPGAPGAPDRLNVQRDHETVLIRIEGSDLPGSSCGPGPDYPDGHHNIHVAVQGRKGQQDLFGLVPADVQS